MWHPLSWPKCAQTKISKSGPWDTGNGLAALQEGLSQVPEPWSLCPNSLTSFPSAALPPPYGPSPGISPGCAGAGGAAACGLISGVCVCLAVCWRRLDPLAGHPALRLLGLTYPQLSRCWLRGFPRYRVAEQCPSASQHPNVHSSCPQARLRHTCLFKNLSLQFCQCGL